MYSLSLWVWIRRTQWHSYQWWEVCLANQILFTAVCWSILGMVLFQTQCLALCYALLASLNCSDSDTVSGARTTIVLLWMQLTSTFFWGRLSTWTIDRNLWQQSLICPTEIFLTWVYQRNCESVIKDLLLSTRSNGPHGLFVWSGNTCFTMLYATIVVHYMHYEITHPSVAVRCISI